MLAHYVLAGATFIVVFIMFLVIARTLNSIINLLTKLEYLVQKEYDLNKELVEVRKLMEDKPVESVLDAKPAPAKPKGAK